MYLVMFKFQDTIHYQYEKVPENKKPFVYPTLTQRFSHEYWFFQLLIYCKSSACLTSMPAKGRLTTNKGLIIFWNFLIFIYLLFKRSKDVKKIDQYVLEVCCKLGN